jgi:hypothetical protein
MRSATRLMIIALLGLSLALLAALSAPSIAAAAPVERPAGDDVVVTTTKATSAPPSSSAGTIEKLNPEQEADKNTQRRKLIMGVTSAVLVGLVIWGRSIRRKRKKAAEGGG